MTESPDSTQPDKDKQLRQLLDLTGIAESYIDFGGNDVPIPLSDRLAVLRLMEIPAANDDQVASSLAAHAWLLEDNPLPRRTVVVSGDGSVPLYFNPERLQVDFAWQLRTESGEQLEGTIQGASLPEQEQVTVAGRPYSIRLWPLPTLAEGYHELTVRGDGRPVTVLLLWAPARCHEPEWLRRAEKLAGLSLQVFCLRSDHDWGMGGFGELRELLRLAGSQGVDFVVINPLHALDSLEPSHCSPYSPMDRRYLNPLYIDIEAVPEFSDALAARELVGSADFQTRLKDLREGDDIDYVGVARQKFAVFRLLYRHWLTSEGGSSARAQQYQDWTNRKGEALRRFAEFETQRHADGDPELTDPGFHMYLQFVADDQLAECQSEAINAGMALGLVRDLAVGSTATSAEVTLNPELFSAGASIGAPPDVFAPQGQNWGLPPMRPRQLEDSGFAHFLELLRDNMAHCGALRVDHVMALMRLWWCPGESHDGAGAYVHYPVDALFAILRLESQRRRCVVIGEDLGVVPPEIRGHIYDSAILSNVLFYFEKYDQQVHFKAPRDYPQWALAMVANHDVPTLKAWWDRTDLELRREIGLLSCESDYGQLLSERESDLIQVLHWLQNEGLLPQGWQDFNIHREFDSALCRAILIASGRSSSLLVSAQFADLCLAERPVNIPGTSLEYPNWRHKLPLTTAQAFANQKTSELLGAFVAARNES